MMMRQRMSDRKVKKLARQTGLDLVGVLVRGNTNHRKDLCLRDGSVKHLWPDGRITDGKFGHGVEPQRKDDDG